MEEGVAPLAEECGGGGPAAAGETVVAYAAAAAAWMANTKKGALHGRAGDANSVVR